MLGVFRLQLTGVLKPWKKNAMTKVSRIMVNTRVHSPREISSSSEDHEDGNIEVVDLRKYSRKNLAHLKNRLKSGSSHSKINRMFIQVIGTGSNGLCPSFMACSDSRAYYFNIGEGCVRVARLHNMLPSRPTVLFFTQPCWEYIGGSASWYFERSIVDKDQKYIGSVRTNDLMSYIKYFTGRHSMRDINCRQNEAGLGVYEDDNLSASIIDLHPRNDTCRPAQAFSFKLADVRGVFFPEKALELGIPSGPAFGMLAEGLSVITEKGDLIHPSQVMTAGAKGSSFLVVDCPNESILEALVTNKHLQPEWFSQTEQFMKLIIHITPIHILQTEKYCKWMSSFGSNTHHLLLHSSLCPGEVMCRDSLKFTLPFHLMNPNVFHFPCAPRQNPISKKDLDVCKYLNEDSVIFGRMLMKYHLKPQDSGGIDCSSVTEPFEECVKKDLQDLKSSENLLNSIVNHRKLLSLNSSLDEKDVVTSLMKQESTPQLADGDDAFITILGTSSAYPTRFRSVSGVLIQTLNDGNVLLDCGEGSLQQMHLCFGRDTTHDIIRKLRCIFVSHWHPDHHIGVIGVLKEREALTRDQENPDPVFVVCPRGYMSTLKRFKNIPHSHIDSYDTLTKPFCWDRTMSIKTVHVDHTPHACGAVLRKNGKWSIAYSGDTTPSDHLIKASRGCSLLIHEGTFEDRFREEALERKHCTYSDAVRIGRKTNAGFTILTHFSPRHEMFPLKKRYSAPLTAPAIDFMSVRISDIREQCLDSHSARNVQKEVLNWVHSSIYLNDPEQVFF